MQNVWICPNVFFASHAALVTIQDSFGQEMINNYWKSMINGCPARVDRPVINGITLCPVRRICRIRTTVEVRTNLRPPVNPRSVYPMRRVFRVASLGHHTAFLYISKSPTRCSQGPPLTNAGAQNQTGCQQGRNRESLGEGHPEKGLYQCSRS